MGPTRHERLAAALLLSLALPVVARAQQSDTVRLTVRVLNQLGLEVPLADVAVRTRDGTVVGRAQTDSAGRAALTFLRSSSGEQLFIRRLGYLPQTQPLPYPLEQSNSIVALLTDADAPTLDTVRTNSSEALRRRIYFIDSTAIAHSPVRIYDGWDVLKKLRPDIAYGRDPINYCPGVQEVFINGLWVVPETVLINPLVMAREPQPSGAAPHLAKAHLANNARGGHRLQSLNALALIKPEHIAQITFRDCREKPIAGMHSTSAVFVVLKDGIAFDPATGSFPIRP
jgi:hypothetical protein